MGRLAKISYCIYAGCNTPTHESRVENDVPKYTYISFAINYFSKNTGTTIVFALTALQTPNFIGWTGTSYQSSSPAQTFGS
jgi:hypothetical protein